jgi:F-type H+-transporting ATPase subunit b
MDIYAPEFWVGVSFFLFIGILFYYEVPRKLGQALDKRAEEISKELEEARKLRQEAEAVLADYRKREKEAENEAEDIVKLAKKEAQSYAAETRKAMQEQFERRTKLAEDKIARAEAQAIADVRAASIEAAVTAARSLIAEKLTPETADKLLQQSIDSLQSKLN